MSIQSRLRSLGLAKQARQRTTGPEPRGIRGQAGSRGNQQVEELEGRRLLSVNVGLTGATSANEGNYPLGVSVTGSSSGAISSVTTNWGDGSSPTTGIGSHEYDGLALPTPYTIRATASGKVITPSAVDGSNNIDDAVVQPDGKTITVGTTSTAISGIEVRRYNVDGSPDGSFGTGGRVVISDPLVISSYAGRGVAVETSGTLVTAIAVAGMAVAGGHNQFLVAKLTPSGAADTSFSGDGIATINFGMDDAAPHAIAIDSSGKVVVAGTASTGSLTNGDFAIARFNANGSLDSSFSGDGLHTTSLEGFDVARGIAFRTAPSSSVVDGIIVVGESNSKFALAIYDLSGAAIITRVEATAERATDVVYANDQAYVSGNVSTFSGDIGLFRYNHDGSLSSGFVNGVATAGIQPAGHNVLNPGLTSLVVAADGTVVVGATLTDADANSSDGGFAALRFKANGTLDTAFGINGIAFTATGKTGLSGGAIEALPLGGFVQAGAVADSVTGGTDGATMFYGTASLAITVQNVAPAITTLHRIDGGGIAAAFEPVVFQLDSTDVSAADRAGIFTLSFNWGDNSPVQTFPWPTTLLGPVSLQPGYAYTHAGTYIPTITVADKDGGSTQISTAPIVVGQAIIKDDVVNGGQMLVVAGSITGPADNKIQIKSSGTAIQAIVDGVASEIFTGVNRVVIYGNDGNDDIQVLAPVTAEVYGGSGNDKIKGNSGHDVLIGEEGDDMIVGGAGRDFMVGGANSDKLVGDSDDDILIGGLYADLDLIELRRLYVSDVMNEWTSGNDYATRVDHLRFGTGANVIAVLAGHDAAETGPVIQTIFDDEAQDKLTGNAGTDWFFANVDGIPADKITDLSSSEFTDADRLFVTGP